MKGSVSLQEGIPETLLSLSLPDVRTQQEGRRLQARKGTLTRNQIDQHLLLDFPASGTVDYQPAG